MMQLVVNQSKLNRTLGSFEKLVNNLRDYSPAMRKAGEIVVQESKDNFDRQGFLYGKAFAPLSESTRKQRVQRGYPGSRPILIRTGKLMNGARVRDVRKDSVTIRNEVDYAVYHQEGTRYMPQRKVLTTTVKSRKAIQLVLANYISDAIRKAF